MRFTCNAFYHSPPTPHPTAITSNHQGSPHPTSPPPTTPPPRIHPHAHTHTRTHIRTHACPDTLLPTRPLHHPQPTRSAWRPHFALSSPTAHRLPPPHSATSDPARFPPLQPSPNSGGLRFSPLVLALPRLWGPLRHLADGLRQESKHPPSPVY
jgi:hypothetical protein